MKACVFYMMVFFVMVGFAGVVMAEKAVAGDDANEVKVSDNAVDDANEAAADANRVENGKELKGIRNDLRKLKKSGAKQSREWTRRRIDTAKLAESVEKQIVDELDLIRSIAFEESATKTMAVIDLVLESRKVRFDELVEALEQKAQDEKKEKGSRGRTDRRRRERGDKNR